MELRTQFVWRRVCGRLAFVLVPGFVADYIGEIVRVNRADGYVVVRCRRLPNEGEEAKVVRRQWNQGLVRFSGPTKQPYAAADIVRGQPEAGDEVMR